MPALARTGLRGAAGSEPQLLSRWVPGHALATHGHARSGSEQRHGHHDSCCQLGWAASVGFSGLRLRGLTGRNFAPLFLLDRDLTESTEAGLSPLKLRLSGAAEPVWAAVGGAPGLAGGAGARAPARHRKQPTARAGRTVLPVAVAVAVSADAKARMKQFHSCRVLSAYRGSSSDVSELCRCQSLTP